MKWRKTSGKTLSKELRIGCYNRHTLTGAPAVLRTVQNAPGTLISFQMEDTSNAIKVETSKTK